MTQQAFWLLQLLMLFLHIFGSIGPWLTVPDLLSGQLLV